MTEQLTREEDMKIEEWREEIDSIDEQILRLVNQRTRIALKIGGLKAKAGIPIYDKEREQDVLTKLCGSNNGPLRVEAVTRIFRRIIHESRSVETHSIARLQSQTREIC